MPSLALLGAGNMGGAILRGAFRAKLISPRDVLIIEPDELKRAAMHTLGCAVDIDPATAADASTLLLAVKPQVFPVVAARLSERANALTARSPLVISIMAGLSSAAIRSALGGAVRVIRAMPNTPAQIGLGMTAVARGGAGVRADDEAFALQLFSSVGEVAVVDEELLHAVTAVSASGPAYLFRLAEAMQRAARDFGFGAEQARQFVTQTLHGAAALLADSHEDPAALRAAVTSKGGTTEAAGRVFEREQFERIVVDALTAARDRARELGE